MIKKQWWSPPPQLYKLLVFALLGEIGNFCASAAGPGVVHGWGEYTRPENLLD